jgi:disulfide oxidoreductase YuzD
MPEFLIAYLKKRYSNEAFEYSYAINDILDKHSTSNEILKFFSAVLSGQVRIQLKLKWENACLIVYYYI